MNWSRSGLKEMAKIALRGSYWRAVLVNLILIAGGRFLTGGTYTGGTSTGVSEYSIARGYSFSQSTSAVDASTLYGYLTPAVMTAILMVGMLMIIFVFNPIEVGCRNFYKEDLLRPVGLETLSIGFTPNYINIVKTQFFRILYSSLWSLLLVIPGIVKYYEYRMIPYLLAEYPNMETREVFRLSREMMAGEKWNAFLLDLSFIGWDLLSIMTGGLANILYVGPYRNLTHAGLYRALKEKIQMA